MDLERINDERRKLGRPALTRAQAENARTARGTNDTDFMNYMIMYAVMEAGSSHASPAHDTYDTGSTHDGGHSPPDSGSTSSTDTGGGSTGGSDAP